MKKLLLLLLITSFSFAQISVSSRHVGKNPSKINKKDLENFKNSTTLFILSNKFTKEEYNTILKEVWTFSKYEILENTNDLDREKYYNGNYTFAELKTIQSSTKMGASLANKTTYIYCIDFYLVNHVKSLKKIKKIKNKEYTETDDLKMDLLKAYKSYNTSIARIYFDPQGQNQKSDSENTKGITLGSGKKKFRLLRYTNVINKFEFENYKLGYLKNYFQLINSKLSSTELFGLYEDKTVIDLGYLSNKNLYYPDYIEQIKDYDFDQKQLTTEELNTKILNGDDFCYLMKTRIRSVGDFTYIINSKTGSCFYYDATAVLGLSNIFDLKRKLTVKGKNLSKTIKKARKK